MSNTTSTTAVGRPGLLETLRLRTRLSTLMLLMTAASAINAAASAVAAGGSDMLETLRAELPMDAPGMNRAWPEFVKAHEGELAREIPRKDVFFQPRSEAVRRAVVDMFEAELLLRAARSAEKIAEERWNLAKGATKLSLEENEPELGRFPEWEFDPHRMMVVRKESGGLAPMVADRVLSATEALLKMPEDAVRGIAGGQFPKEFAEADQNLKEFLKDLGGMVVKDSAARVAAKRLCGDLQFATSVAWNAKTPKPLRWLARAAFTRLRREPAGAKK